MKALVTGAAGFIGSQVVRQLVERKISVNALVLPGDNLVNLKQVDCNLIEGNILNPADISKAAEGCDYIFHLAAIYALWLPDMGLMHRVNVEGTENVLRAAKESSTVKKVVYTSSIAVYGGQGLDYEATENSAWALGGCENEYAASKYEAHTVAQRYAADGLDLVIVAPCGPLGPGDYGPTPTGKLLLDLLHLPVLPVINTESNFIDVRDCAAGHLLALDKGEPGRSYLLGNENWSLHDLAETAAAMLDLERPVVDLPLGLVESASHLLEGVSQLFTRRAPFVTPSAVRIARLGLKADCSRAFTELGLPRRPIEESIRDALVWFGQNGYITSASVLEKVKALY